MSQTQFSAFPGNEVVVEERTSIMAIVSLVLALICFVPGLGVLAAILGIAALFMIGGSRGRVGGKGLAISGLIIGLLVSALWIGFAIGASKFYKMAVETVAKPGAEVVAAAGSGDFEAARKILVPATANALTDEDFKRFRAEYEAELGAFKGLPDGPMQYLQHYGALGPLMQRFQGRQDVVPLPGLFDNGPGLLVVELDQSAAQPKPGSGVLIPVKNIMILAPSEKQFTLHDPTKSSGTPPSVAPTPPEKGDK